MSLEMVGSRILAPTFGTSIYVWGSLISTVMAALTLGYYWGGKIADQRPNLRSLGLILCGAGIFIGTIPFWSPMANQFFVAFGPQAGSLCAALSFFFTPSVLLAMISPYGIRLATRNLTTIGNTAGHLSAVSSGGSILGTLLTSFFLIPWMGVRNIIHMLGVILLILAGLALTSVFIKNGKSRDDIKNILMVFVLLSSLTYLWAIAPQQTSACQYDGQTLLVKDTLYHKIIVDQTGNERHLHFDNSYQSAVDLDNPQHMLFEYTSYIHLAVVACPQPRRVLIIGLGGGLIPYRFLLDYPSLEQVDAVEIDPEVVKVARRYFPLPKDPRFRTVSQDGRLFVEKKAEAIAAGTAQPYDIVIIDAFAADAIPYHLTTREFQQAVHRILAPDGVVAMNIIAATDGPAAKLLAAMSRTTQSVYPQIYLFSVGDQNPIYDTFDRNIILIATNQTRRWDRRTWIKSANDLMGNSSIRENVGDYAEHLLDEDKFQRLLHWRNAPILTDDYSPTDTLQHPI
jgi:spermidine synthase